MAKRKMRKFAEGGISDAQEEWLTRGGQSPDRTDPYILARMRSAVPDSTDTYENNAPYKNDNQGLGPNTNVSAENKPFAPVTKTVTRTSVTAPAKVAPKPTPETPTEYKARMEGLQSKDALINVSPEDYVTPGGVLKGMLKKVISNSAKNALKTYTAREMAEMAPKMIGRESLKLGREPLKLGMKKGGSVKKMASGGKVSSASKRADGCAIRGKTRA